MVFTKYEGSGQTDLYAKALRFSTRMFDDHMPWGYNSLFAGGSPVKKKLTLMYLTVIVRGW